LEKRGYNEVLEKARISSMKRTPARAILFSVAALVTSCATLPSPETARTSVYRNVHNIQFQYPSSWALEDVSKNYGTLIDAEEEGASYIQVYSYDPLTAQAPTEAVSPAQVKISLILSNKAENLDYRKLLARVGNGMSERSLFRINGKEAYELRYRVTNEESTEKLEILSIEYIVQDLYAKFICYPWNSVHVKEFEALARSFRYRGM